MYKVLLFAGTSEGRQIAQCLDKAEIKSCVFVATEYGETLIPETKSVHVEAGRLDRDQMLEKMKASPEAYVIDATHPYAAVVTENIRSAAEICGLKYIRVLRERTEAENAVYVESPEAAAEYLTQVEGNVLLTTGSKELAAFTAVPKYQERLFARVLSLPSVVCSCADLGFQGNHLICMQGPFSYEMNCALIHQVNAQYLVTKDTGLSGGFPEKVKAAADCGCQLIVIGRPLQEDGISLADCIKLLSSSFAEHTGFISGKLQEKKDDQGCLSAAGQSKQEIALIGIGMGGASNPTLTAQAREYISSADLLIGARRMVQDLCRPGQKCLIEYRAAQIAEYINTHKEYHKTAVLLSGDTGFFSGAKGLLKVLPENTRVIPGIGSLVYFCSRIPLSWDDVKITSNHGRTSNLIGLCQENRKVFTLLGKPEDVKNICKKFVYYGMTDVTVHVGESFCYPEEKILSGKPENFLDYAGTALSVMLIENPQALPVAVHGIPDDCFLRDKVPMTKEEIREISISKLHLLRDSVIYDVGAGSGSVSVEMAKMALEGSVYAIEKNPTAVALLDKNKQKFRTDNLTIIDGYAPEALLELPTPTHAFIGGSSGNLKEILTVLYQKNPSIRVVVNAITLETVQEALEALKTLPFGNEDIAAVQAAKSKQIGRYHMMMGQNPVYIISMDGIPEDNGDLL